MKVDQLDAMLKGWFIGDFEPTLYRTGDVEVALKRYEAGDHEPSHHHKIATEITAVVSGTVRMDGRELGPGEIVTLAPGESSDFTALTDATVVAVKLPGAPGDKYEDDAC